MLVVLAGFLYSLVVGGVDPPAWSRGSSRGSRARTSLLLATGMLGATVMPHVIYLHGSLTQHRYARATEEQRMGLLRSQRLDVVAAMSLAGVVNIIMLVVAARLLSGSGVPAPRSRAPTPDWVPRWDRPPPRCSRWRCSPPASPRRVSARSPARW